MAILTVILDQKGLKNQLIVVPKFHTDVKVNVEKVEQLNENNFLLTYEVIKEGSIKFLNSRYNVFIKGTNYTYPHITGYSFAKGGFFTKSAQDQKKRSVVLNELAAFEIFGNNNIIGEKILLYDEPYTIVGVINDQDTENKNVYIPVTILSDSPTTVLTFIDSDNEITKEYIKNELKEIDVTDTSHDFINFAEIRSIIRERTMISVLLVSFTILIFILKVNTKKLINSYRDLKNLLMQHYFKDILRKKPDIIYGLLIRSFYIVFCLSTLSLIANNIFKMCINWNVDTSVLMKLNYESFIDKIQFIQYAYIFSTIAFVSFIIILVLLFISAYKLFL